MKYSRRLLAMSLFLILGASGARANESPMIDVASEPTENLERLPAEA